MFKRGHRLRLDVTSSSFPRFSRNLNTGEDVGTGTRMEVAQQTVLHTERLSVARAPARDPAMSGALRPDGRTALVTGSTRGIGSRSRARSPGPARGSRSTAGRRGRARSRRAGARRAFAAPFDVTDEAAVTAASSLGPVDMLVNNAGMTMRKPLEEFSLEEWQRLFA